MQEIYSKLSGVTHSNDNGNERQQLIAHFLRKDTPLRLQPDPENKHGSHAVKALVEDKKGNAYQVGWVKGGDGPEADLDDRIFDALQNGQTVTCQVTDITGGTKQKPIRGVNVLYRLYEPGETPPPSKTAKPKTKKTWLIIAGVVILLCLLIIIAMPTQKNDKTNPGATVAAIQTQAAETIIAAVTATQTPIPPTQESTAGGKTAQEYLDEYGGEITVYQDFIASNDCVFLQESFDRAYNNNQVALNNDDAFKRRYTLGYMDATDERMKEIGCYAN